MMYTLSVSSVILDVNEHWLKEMAYSRDEVIGASAAKFHDPPVDFGETCPLWGPLHTGAEHASAELRLVTRTGQRIEGLGLCHRRAQPRRRAHRRPPECSRSHRFQARASRA